MYVFVRLNLASGCLFESVCCHAIMCWLAAGLCDVCDYGDLRVNYDKVASLPFSWPKTHEGGGLLLSLCRHLKPLFLAIFVDYVYCPRGMALLNKNDKKDIWVFCPILEQTLQEKHSSDTWLHSATFFVRQWEMGQSDFFYPCCTRLTLKLALCVLYVYVHSPIPKCSTRMCGWFICFTTIGPAGRERIDSQEILQMCKTKIKNVWFVLFMTNCIPTMLKRAISL